MYKLLWLQNLKGRNHEEDLGVDGIMILEWILGNRLGKCGVNAYGLG
jgi:hypothetical protein